MDQQSPFGPPDPYAQRPFAPPDPYAPPMPIAAPPRQSYVPFVVGGLVIALVAVVGLVTLGFRVAGDRVREAFPAGGSYGTAGDAVCDPVQHDPLPAEGLVHEEGAIDYGLRPPSLGVHNPRPLERGPRVVPWEGASPLVAERAVHNLEHAYVVVWYDSTGAGSYLDHVMSELWEPKVLAVPWKRVAFDGNADFVLAAWGHRQSCAFVTPGVIEAFYETYGGENGDAPEKGAL